MEKRGRKRKRDLIEGVGSCGGGQEWDGELKMEEGWVLCVWDWEVEEGDIVLHRGKLRKRGIGMSKGKGGC